MQHLLFAVTCLLKCFRLCSKNVFVNIMKADRERMSNARHRDNHLMSSGKFKRAYFPYALLKENIVLR